MMYKSWAPREKDIFLRWARSYMYVHVCVGGRQENIQFWQVYFH